MKKGRGRRGSQEGKLERRRKGNKEVMEKNFQKTR